MMPQNSVVMATYRQAKYLRDSIGSVLKNLEGLEGYLCLVPVCGDSETSEWMRSSLKPLEPKLKEKVFIHPSIKADLWHQRQLGLNTGLFRYVTFFDSDDVMLPGWLDRGLKVAQEITSRGNIPIVGPSYRMVDEKLRPIQDVILPEFTMKAMMGGCIIPDFSITTTEALRSVGGFFDPDGYDPGHPYYSYAMFLRVLKKYGSKVEVKLLPEIGFLYRQHKKAMHHRFAKTKKKSQENVRTQQEIARHYFAGEA